MDAVSTVYRIVSEELEKESVSIERILESIKEPMLVIDDNYADTLERADSKKEGDFMSFDQCRDIASLMTGFTKPWFVAGGWAIDLFVGRETRNHKDIEIAIFRKDQLYLKKYLKEWDFKKVIKGEVHSWQNEHLELPVHEIHASNNLNGGRIEILLNEREDQVWRFRRDMRISLPINSVWSYSKTGIPYLNPEIVLLFKAKNTRDKDHLDFIAINDYLDAEKKHWLRTVLETHEPGHKWIKSLF